MRTLAALLLLASASIVEARTIEGQVFAPDGTLAGEATITAYLPESSADEARRGRGARTALRSMEALKGRFRIDGLPDSVVELVVTTKAVAPVTRFLLPDESEVTVSLGSDRRGLEMQAPTEAVRIERRPAAPPQRGDRSLAGVVRLDGKPLAGFPVLVRPMINEPSSTVRVISDSQGRFALAGLAPLRYAVTPAEGFHERIRLPYEETMHEEGREPFAVDLRSAKNGVASLEFAAARRIGGRVTAADGTPVSGAEIRLVLAGRPPHEFGRTDPVRTFPDGHYTVTVPEFDAKSQLEVIVLSRARSAARSKPFALAALPERVDVVLPPMHRITVRVVDGEGAPVANAVVAFATPAESHAVRDVTMLLDPAFASWQVRTGPNGLAPLELEAGSYEFAARAAGFQTAALASRSVLRPATIDFPLEKAFAIRGRVHRGGTGVPGVQLSIAGGPVRESFVQTEGDGSFAIEGLPRGRYEIQVTKHEEMISRVQVAEAPSTLDIELPPAGLLRGRVTDAATGAPLRHFVFAVEALGGDRRRQPQMQRAGDGGDGAFEATLSAGTYQLSVAAPGYVASEPLTVRVDAEKPLALDIELDPGLSLSGRVTGESGEPVAQAQVVAMTAAQMRGVSRHEPRVGPARMESDDQGNFRLTGIVPGEVNLMVRKEGYVPYRRLIDVTSSEAIDIQLTRGLSIEGIVTKNGRPVPDAQVGAASAAIGGEHQQAVTDRSGRFVLRGLVPARYTLSAYHDESHAEVPDVDPTARRTIEIALDAPETGVVYGVVRGMSSTGKTVESRVFVQGTGRGAEGSVDAAGNYRVENAPAGSVRVRAEVATSNGTRLMGQEAAEVVAGGSTRVDIDLGGNIAIRGRVSQEGRPIAGADVVFMTGEGIGGAARSGPEGHYEVTLASPGLYRIFAHAERRARTPFQVVREIRGSQTIDIDLREIAIEGTVLDAATARPVAGAMVTLTPERDQELRVSNETMTDASGRFRLLTGATGPQRLIVAAFGYAQTIRAIDVSGNAALAQIELSPVAGTRVRVVDARTRTPLEAHIVVRGLPARADRSSDGKIYVFSLAPGRYTLDVTALGYATKTVEISAPGEMEIALE